MLCVSVNDAVVHGVPNGYLLADGDLVSVDFGAIVKGWCGDAARPGNTLGDVGHAIATAAHEAGYGLVADHGGHGIGRTMHEDRT